MALTPSQSLRQRLQARLISRGHLRAAAVGSAEEWRSLSPDHWDLAWLTHARSPELHLPPAQAMTPYANANRRVQSLWEACLSLPTDRPSLPLLPCVCATDPEWRIPRSLERLRENGAPGIANFPTLGLFHPHFRADVELSGFPLSLEAKAMALAHELGLFTMAMVCEPDQAQEAAKAGADLLVAHPSPWIAEQGAPWDGSTASVLHDLCESARSVRSDLPILAFLTLGGQEDRLPLVKSRFPGLAGIFVWEP